MCPEGCNISDVPLYVCQVLVNYRRQNTKLTLQKINLMLPNLCHNEKSKRGNLKAFIGKLDKNMENHRKSKKIGILVYKILLVIYPLQSAHRDSVTTQFWCKYSYITMGGYL